MKIFFSTLAAILVAAVIIGIAVGVYKTAEKKAKWDSEIRRLNLESELTHAETEWDEQMSKNPQFDPNAKQLGARLREIREASENGKPIPPSHWQTTATTSNNSDRQRFNLRRPPRSLSR